MKFIIVLFAASILVATTSSVIAGDGPLDLDIDSLTKKLGECLEKLLKGAGLSDDDFKKIQPSLDALTDLLKKDPTSVLSGKNSEFNEALNKLLNEASKYVSKDVVPSAQDFLECLTEGLDLSKVTGNL